MIKWLSNLFKKAPRPVLTAKEKLTRTLRNIDRMGGGGDPAHGETLKRMLDLEQRCDDRRVLAELTGVSEYDLVDTLREHMRHGGTRFACIGLISFYLDE